MPSSRFAGFVTVTRYKFSAGHYRFNLLFHRLLGIGAVSSSGSSFCRHFDSFRILNAPCPTMKNTIVPTIRSGYFEFVK